MKNKVLVTKKYFEGVDQSSTSRSDNLIIVIREDYKVLEFQRQPFVLA